MFKEVDKKLWESFIKGDDDAFNGLYTQFVNTLYAFGLRYADDAELVKDSIHDLFIDLYKYRKTLKADVNVKSYLFTSLKRKIFLLLKQESRKGIFEADFMFSFSIEDQMINNEEQSELKAKLKKQLTLLPSRQKEAIYLRFNAELEYEEIATVMNISMETCRTLVYRGIKQLRENLVIQHVE